RRPHHPRRPGEETITSEGGGDFADEEGEPNFNREDANRETVAAGQPRPDRPRGDGAHGGGVVDRGGRGGRHRRGGGRGGPRGGGDRGPRGGGGGDRGNRSKDLKQKKRGGGAQPFFFFI